MVNFFIVKITQVVNFFNITTGKLIQYQVVKKFIDIHSYSTKREHVEKLYQTILDSTYHVAFEPEKYKHVAITFHSSKGLEFDQVVIFAEDYRLSDMSSICNHYVAVTRAKHKLIIVCINNFNTGIFLKKNAEILSESNLCLTDVALLPD